MSDNNTSNFDPPIQEQITTIRDLVDKLNKLVGKASYTASYHIPLETWSLHSPTPSECGMMGYNRITSVLYAAIRNHTVEKEKSDNAIDRTEAQRLAEVGHRHLSYLADVSNGRIPDDDDPVPYVLFEGHTSHRLPRFSTDLDNFLDVIKWMTYVAKNEYWMIRFFGPDPHYVMHNPQESWEQLKTRLMEAVNKELVAFPYYIKYHYFNDAKAQTFVEIKRLGLPADTPKEKLYQWLWFTNDKVIPLDFQTMTRVPRQGKAHENQEGVVRSFSQGVLVTYEDGEAHFTHGDRTDIVLNRKALSRNNWMIRERVHSYILSANPALI